MFQWLVKRPQSSQVAKARLQRIMPRNDVTEKRFASADSPPPANVGTNFPVRADVAQSKLIDNQQPKAPNSLVEFNRQLVGNAQLSHPVGSNETPAVDPFISSPLDVPRLPKPRQPAMLTEINTVVESEATRVRMLADSPLEVRQVAKLPDSDILRVHLANTTISTGLLQAAFAQQGGTVSNITFDTEGESPPGSVVYIHLTRWGLYEVTTIHNELHIVFEASLLDRRVTIRAEAESAVPRAILPPEEPEEPEELGVKVFHLHYIPVATAKAALKDLLRAETKIIEDERTQSIILIDTQAQLTQADPLLDRVIETLDQEVIDVNLEPEPQMPPPTKRVIRINYADPSQIKDTLISYLTNAGSIEVFDTPSLASGGQGGETDLGEAVGRGGHIVVIDLPDNVVAIEQAIAELDVPIPQVEIQVHIIENDRSNGSDVGVDWTATDKERDASLDVSGTGGQLKMGALTAEEFTATLRVLETQSDARLLASPHITVMENKLAQFHSGEEVPFRRIIIQDGIEAVDVYFKSVGIVLTVMAQVKADNQISLLINAQISSVGERPSEGEPAINTRKAATQMLIPDGDTVTIGGLSNERKIERVSKVPVWGHIPLLGGLFSSRQHTRSLNEITIYLTPTLIEQ